LKMSLGSTKSFLARGENAGGPLRRGRREGRKKDWGGSPKADAYEEKEDYGENTLSPEKSRGGAVNGGSGGRRKIWDKEAKNEQAK